MISSVLAYQRLTMGSLINEIYGSTFAVAKQNIPRRFQNRMPKDKKYSHQKIEKFSTTLIKLYN